MFTQTLDEDERDKVFWAMNYGRKVIVNFIKSNDTDGLFDRMDGDRVDASLIRCCRVAMMVLHPVNRLYNPIEDETVFNELTSTNELISGIGSDFYHKMDSFLRVVLDTQPQKEQKEEE